MCNNEIVLYPNEILKSKTKSVDDVNSEEIQNYIDDLLNTMNAYNHCVGLAANQIGINYQIFVADASKNKSCNMSHGLIIAVNPKVTVSEGTEISREGCMSVPDLTGNVTRSVQLEFEARDRNGEVFNLSVNGFEARVIQHEIDHLNGKVFLDRVKSARDVYSRKKYR
ncbi:MAG: peptide deformylase [Acidimicrobiia bacterium]